MIMPTIVFIAQSIVQSKVQSIVQSIVHSPGFTPTPSYMFSYPRRQDFGGTNQITERNYDIINRVRAHNLQHETFTTERSRRTRDVRKNANSRATTVASCVSITVVQGMFTTATHSAIHEYQTKTKQRIKLNSRGSERTIQNKTKK